jgi:hypothetical protein
LERTFKSAFLKRLRFAPESRDFVADQFADRDVIYTPDADLKGEANLAKALPHLKRVSARVRVVRLEGLKRREDLFDWLEAGHTAEELLALAAAQPVAGAIDLAPYIFPDEKDIPPYEWLYGGVLLRGTVTVTAAPGGVGKSNLNIAEALSIASGRSILGHSVLPNGARVALINFEDNRNTMDKRLAAARRIHEIDPAEVGNRLFVVAKDEVEAVFGGSFCIAAAEKWGEVIRNKTLIKALVDWLVANAIDVLIIDPLTLAHNVRENDPGQFRAAVEAFGYVAVKAGIAVSLWHHTRKENGNEMTIESVRGALSMTDAARYARLGEKMSKDDAKRLNIPDPWRHFRLFSGKANYAPPAEVSEWYRIETVQLDNGFPFGEDVSAVTRWKHPGVEALKPTPNDLKEIKDQIIAGIDREDPRANAWTGRVVADVLGLDLEENKERIKALLKNMVKDGQVKVATRKDKHGKVQPFYIWTNPEKL